MANTSKKKTVKKAAPKAIAKASKAKAPVKTNAVKKAARPVIKATAKKATPIKKKVQPVAAAKKAAPAKTVKPAKPVAVPSKAKVVAKTAPAKKVAPPAKPAPVAKTPPAKPAPAAKTAPAKPDAQKPAPPAAKNGNPPTKRSRQQHVVQVIDPDIPVIHLDKPPADLKDSISRVIRKKLHPGEKRLLKTETINPHIIKDKPLEPLKKPKPEPKGKYTMEYILHAPVTLLYDFLTTPNGMAEWFADGVDLKNDTYTFDWDGAKQQAVIVSAKLDNSIRLHWLDKPEGTYFEFQINADELTGEIQLLVTDFGESEDDIITSRRLWEAQIQRLLKAMGSY